MPGGELLEAQRNYAIGQLEAGVSVAKVASTLGCVRQTLYNLKHRSYNTNTTTSAPRIGRPSILTRRQHRRLLRVVKKFKKIQ